jgi:hypothetical protein
MIPAFGPIGEALMLPPWVEMPTPSLKQLCDSGQVTVSASPSYLWNGDMGSPYILYISDTHEL